MTVGQVFIAIFDQIQTTLPKSKYVCQFVFNGDSYNPILIKAGRRNPSIIWLKESVSMKDIANIESLGHAERFGAEIARKLILALNKNAKEPRRPRPRRAHEQKWEAR